MNEMQLMVEQNQGGIPMIPSETYAISLARFGDVVLFDIKGDMTAFSEPFFDSISACDYRGFIIGNFTLLHLHFSHL